MTNDAAVQSWLANWPELTTRQNLVTFICSAEVNADNLRHLLFKHLGYMEQVRFIPDLNVAKFCLQELYARGKNSITTQYSESVPHSVFAECVGVLRNRFKNIRAELDGSDRISKKNIHDVDCVRT